MFLIHARLGALALVTALFVSLAGVASAPESSAALSPNDFDAEVVRLVNVERVKHKLPKLIAVPSLQAKARNWSETMASGKGSGKFDHAPTATIEADHKAAQCSGVWSENIMFATGRVSTPQFVVDKYMASKGHREAILEKSFRYMASGSALASKSVFNTQRFAASCGSPSIIKGWSTKQTVTVKKAATDTIKVTGPARVVKLQKHTGKKWVTVKKFKANASGKVKVTFPASKSAKKVKYRTVVSGNSTYRAAASKTKVVTYKKPSQVSGWSAKQAVKVKKTAKDSITVTGSKRVVKLQKHTGKKWVTVKKFKTNAKGRVRITLPASASAKKIAYRTTVAATAKNRAAKSTTKVLIYKK